CSRLLAIAAFRSYFGCQPRTRFARAFEYRSDLKRACKRHGIKIPGNFARPRSSTAFVVDAAHARNRIANHGTGTTRARAGKRSCNNFTYRLRLGRASSTMLTV